MDLFQSSSSITRNISSSSMMTVPLCFQPNVVGPTGTATKIISPVFESSPTLLPPPPVQALPSFSLSLSSTLASLPSTTTTTTTQQQKSNRNEPNSNTNHCLTKRCRVCGDKALGFNFNGLSCESCKSFFRRNAFKQDRLICYKNENCMIDQITRKHCPSCRLAKCFAIGMKKELIMAREIADSSSSNSCNSSNQNPKQSQSKQCELLYSLLTEIDTSSNVELSNENPNDISVAAEAAAAAAATTNPYTQSTHQYSNTSVTPPPPPQPSSSKSSSSSALLSSLSSSKELNLFELKQVQLICIAMEEIFVEENNLPIIGCINNNIEAFNTTGLYIRKVVKFCKQMPSFRCLNANDQLTVVKQFFTYFILIRFGYNHISDYGHSTLICDESNQRSMILKFQMLRDCPKKFETHFLQFAILVKNETDHDCIIRNLLITLVMFVPNEKISCPEYFRYNYHFYSHLLHRYLACKYHDHRVVNKRFKQLQKIASDELRKISALLYELYCYLDATQIVKIWTEIYNYSL